MFYGAIIKLGVPCKPQPEDGGEILHLSQACLVNGDAAAPSYLMVQPEDGNKYAVCGLSPKTQTHAQLDLFLSTNTNVKLSVQGKGEIHLLGYFEPNEGEDSEEDEDDVNRMVSKKALIQKGKANSDGDDTQAGDESADSDVEEDSDDLDLGKDDESSENSGNSEEEVDENSEDEQTSENDAANNTKQIHLNKQNMQKNKQIKNPKVEEERDSDIESQEEDEEEDSQEEEEEEEKEEEEEEEVKPKRKDTKNKKVEKKIETKKVEQKKRKSVEEEPTSAKKAKSGGVDKFVADIAAYLKTNGKTSLSTIGGQFKKPTTVEKLGQFLKERKTQFFVENGFVSLKK